MYRCSGEECKNEVPLYHGGCRLTLFIRGKLVTLAFCGKECLLKFVQGL